MAHATSLINPRSGFSPSTSIFHSKRPPLLLPAKDSLNATTFISSRPHHGHTAFIDASTGRHLTFTQFWRAVDSVSSSLSNLGIRKGDVILLLSPNSIFFPVILHSVISLGAIITTANPINTVTEIATQIADSKSVLAFTTHSLLPKLSLSPLLPIILIDENQNNKNNKIISTLIKMIQANAEPVQFTQASVNQDDTATILYSSGTTGRSKGVISTHRNLIVMVQNVLTRITTAGETVMATVPMFHIYGLSFFAMGLLASGSTIIVLSRFDKDEMLSAVERYSVTYLPLAPPVIMAMINNADEIKRRCKLSSLQTVLSGGAPLCKEVIEAFLVRYPKVNVFQGYALTESTAVGASTDSVEESMRFGSVGLLAASLEAKIVELESGQAVGVNRTGELWIRGPAVMKGYLNNPEATASTIDTVGWLKTGDLCYIDDDGFIFIVDRLKELIKYKGYQVPPAELEALLLTHPQISDAAVIPFPDKDAGQCPMAYVVRKDGYDLSESSVMDFVARQVAPYKRIRRVEFTNAIPKNPAGKILRKDLVKLATSRL